MVTINCYKIKTEIPYEEIITHWNDENWEDWKSVEYIADSINYTKEDKYQDYKSKVLNFLNNYIWESEIVRNYPELNFIEGNHNTFHYGNGNSIPDVYSIYTGLTYEIKKMWNYDIMVKIVNGDINPKTNKPYYLKTHGADGLICYIPTNGNIYKVMLDTKQITPIGQILVPNTLN